MLPKALRMSLRLTPGDSLELESDGDEVTLRPVRAKALLAKEKGVWVFQGGPTDSSIPDLIDRGREQRFRELMG